MGGAKSPKAVLGEHLLPHPATDAPVQRNSQCRNGCSHTRTPHAVAPYGGVRDGSVGVWVGPRDGLGAPSLVLPPPTRTVHYIAAVLRPYVKRHCPCRRN